MFPCTPRGEPKGVKLQGGLLEMITREIEIECLPDEIPELYTVDVTELMIGQNLRASEIPLGGSVKLVSPAEQVIAHVVTLKAEVVETPAAEGAVGCTPAEPEVIKKGKKEEEAKPSPRRGRRSRWESGIRGIQNTRMAGSDSGFLDPRIPWFLSSSRSWWLALGNPGEEYELTAHNLGILGGGPVGGAERNQGWAQRFDRAGRAGNDGGQESVARQAANVHES